MALTYLTMFYQVLVSYADGIQLGMITAMGLASKGSFPKLNIRTEIPDSDSPDTLSELPLRRANFTELKEQFAEKDSLQRSS